MSVDMLRGAVISDNKLYRYVLTRTWDLGGPVLAWCGLNPSTADHLVDDPTIGREIKFSQRWGYGGMVKVNMFGFRAANPHALVYAGYEGIDVVGPDNDEAIWKYTEGLTMIAAWGASVPLSKQPRVKAVAYRMRRERATYTLGFTKDGWPRHPLYVRRDTDPVRWAA